MISDLLAFIPGVGPVLAWLAKRPMVRRAIVTVLVVLALIGVLFGIYRLGVHDERQRAAIATAQANAEAETKAAAARAAAAIQSQADAATVAASTEGLKHADDAQPDAVPNAKSRAFDCERLRRAHVSTAGLGCPG